MKKKMKIGVLGFASIAKKAIIPAIKKSSCFHLSGIASRNEKNKTEIESEIGTKFYSTYESLVLDKSITSLYIPLPNSLHFKWAKLALENGKNLLIEKSLGCSYDEVKELVQLARKNNLTILENFQFRKHSQLKWIKEYIESKEIGEVRVLKSSFGFPPFPDKNNIRYQKELGGGALLDAGAYTIKVAQEMLGLEVEVTSAMLNYNNTEVDIWGTGSIQSNNMTIQFSFGFDHHYQCCLEAWGSKGKLYTNRLFTAPPGFEPSVVIEKPEGTKTVKLEADNHFVKMLEYFYYCIHNDEEKEKEYQVNINQARLIQDFLKIAKISK